MYILHDVWTFEQRKKPNKKDLKGNRCEFPTGSLFAKKHMLNQHKQTELRGQHVRYNVIMSTKNVH